MSEQATSYEPPRSLEELLRRYAGGERIFPETDLSDVDFSGVRLEGASFEKWSRFDSCVFDGANLRRTSFRNCHVKCADFRHADLTDASFELAAIEATDFEGAKLEGVSFVGATAYGSTIADCNWLPPH